MDSIVYLSLDYKRSLARYVYADDDGGSIEVNPDSRRLALSANINLNRALSFLVTADSLDSDDLEERRILSGIVVRF